MTACAVLLDRDGTLNERIVDDYVRTPEQLQLLPGAAAAVGRLNRAGLPVLLVTNQRGVGRALMTQQDLTAVHRRLAAELAVAGAWLDGIYVCPHDRGRCDCRKPLPGLARQIVTDHSNLDLTRSVVIGDSDDDMGFARAIGARGVLIGGPRAADRVVATLQEAVDLVLEGVA